MYIDICRIDHNSGHIFRKEEKTLGKIKKKNCSSCSVNHHIMKDLITVIMVCDTVLEIMLFLCCKNFSVE
jgi:hypothetical protein